MLPIGPIDFDGGRVAANEDKQASYILDNVRTY